MPHTPMDGAWWIDSATQSLLDYGCNVGEALADIAAHFPNLRLAGVDINPVAVERARQAVPRADIRVIDRPRLPFADEVFDAVTCIEVLEHVPAADRASALAEMRRVLKVGGRLILRCPHAGAFSFLDPDNLRFRFPRLYRHLISRGRRDAAYADGVKWHDHFREAELLGLAGAGFAHETTRYGGLFLLPIGGWIAWPFYKTGRYNHPALRAVQRMISWDIAHDYGRASYCILMILRKLAPASA
jgi:SAM-dependent methyltransferase